MTIRAQGRLYTPEEFGNIVLREQNGIIVQVKDVAEVVLEAQNTRTIMRGNNGKPQVGVALTPLPGANYIEIADEVYRRVEAIKRINLKISSLITLLIVQNLLEELFRKCRKLFSLPSAWWYWLSFSFSETGVPQSSPLSLFQSL